MIENIRMIYGNSNDPVLIKKISLKIWTLRDEIEAVLKKRWEKLEDPSYEDLLDEYQAHNNLLERGPKLSLVNEDNQNDPNNNENQSPPEEAPTKEQNGEAQEIIIRRPAIPSELIAHGTAVLAEMNMEEIFFFSSQNFIEGQSVVISFDIPEHFSLSAEILISRKFNQKNRVISGIPKPYRILAKFTFIKAGERTLLRNFIKSIESIAHIETPPNNSDISDESKDESSNETTE